MQTFGGWGTFPTSCWRVMKELGSYPVARQPRPRPDLHVEHRLLSLKCRSTVGAIACCAALMLAAGCERVPSGAHFERTRAPMPFGIFLSDQRLTFPWVPLSSTGNYRWCFANLGFSGSSAQVFLEVLSGQPFDPRNVGGAARVRITDSASRVAYQAVGPLRDTDHLDVRGRNRWVSEYFHYSSGPPRDKKSAYFGEPEFRAKIGGFGSYCVALSISQASPNVQDTQTRVVLQSGWK